jgi:hypothetical protein
VASLNKKTCCSRLTLSLLMILSLNNAFEFSRAFDQLILAGNSNSIYFFSNGEPFETLSGQLEQEDMLLKAHAVTINDLKLEQCLMTVQADKSGEVFDYDMEIQARTSATTAKMIRFFEKVAIEVIKLDTNFKPLDEPIEDHIKVEIISDIKRISKVKLYSMTCPYDFNGTCVGRFEGKECNEFFMFHV